MSPSPKPAAPSIWDRRHELEKERRAFLKTAMADFDKEHYAKLAVLRAECKEHTWRFTHLGPLGNAWYCCGQCGATRMG